MTDGDNPSGNVAGAQQIKLDFDSVLGITADASSGGEKFMLETTSDRVNYHIGADSDDDRMFAFYDVRSTNLGLSETRSLSNISVTTLTGAGDAVDVVDAALDQLNLVEATMGALESRMQNTSSSLDLYSTNLTEAATVMSSADIAKETTDLVMNYVLLNAQSATLLQSNMIPKTIFPMILGIKD